MRVVEEVLAELDLSDRSRCIPVFNKIDLLVDAVGRGGPGAARESRLRADHDHAYRWPGGAQEVASRPGPEGAPRHHGPGADRRWREACRDVPGWGGPGPQLPGWHRGTHRSGLRIGRRSAWSARALRCGARATGSARAPRAEGVPRSNARGGRVRYLVTGTAGFIGYHVAERLLARGDEVTGLDNVNDYYDVRLKHARMARLDGKRGYDFVKLDVSDREGMEQVFARAQARGRDSPGRPGRRALLAHQSPRLRPEQPRRLHEHPRGVPPSARAPPRLCVVEQRVRRQHPAAVQHPRQHRPSGEPVRREQEGQRADGAHLQPSLRPADHRAAVLHGLRPLGPAGHGDVPLHQGDPRGEADRRLQPREDAARLHLHRRHRRGHRAHGGSRGDAKPGVLERRRPIPARARRPTGSTTSATTTRSS